MKSVVKGDVEVPVNQNFYYYLGMSGDNSKFEKRASGAYIFRPNTTLSGGGQPIPITERVFSYQVYKGNAMPLAHLHSFLFLLFLEILFLILIRTGI